MGTIPYNLNIPAGPNNPSQDQPDMQENTNSINQIIDVDHFTFVSSGARDGWHKQSTYPISTIAPPTLAFQGAVYTKDVGGGVVQLFYRRELNGPEIQITSGDIVTNTPRAFVNFDGTVAGFNAAQTIRSSYNVTSVTRIGAASGLYQVNFTTALPSNNYVALLTGQRTGIGSGYVYGAILDVAYATAVTTTTLQIAFSSQGSNLHNVNMGNVVVLGG